MPDTEIVDESSEPIRTDGVETPEDPGSTADADAETDGRDVAVPDVAGPADKPAAEPPAELADETADTPPVEPVTTAAVTDAGVTDKTVTDAGVTDTPADKTRRRGGRRGNT